MYATTWLDRETFTAIVDYCRALPTFEEPDSEQKEEEVKLTSSAGLPDLGGYAIAREEVMGLTFAGALDACIRLFDLGVEGRVDEIPSVRVKLKADPSAEDPVMELAAEVSYAYRRRSIIRRGKRKGEVFAAHTELSAGTTAGTPEQGRGVLAAIIGTLGLSEAIRVEADEDGTCRLVSLDEGFGVVHRFGAGMLEPNPILSEGRTAVRISTCGTWVVVQRPAPEAQPRALNLIEALGRHRVSGAMAFYVSRRDEYDRLRGATKEIRGKWRVSFTTRGGYSLADLADTPERIPDEVNSLKVGCDVSLPVVGETHVGVDAEREPDGTFRYRLRFYPDYEHGYDRPDVREVRPSETEEGRGLPFLRELEDEALEGVGPRDHMASAEDLAMHALFRQWGEGHDIIDYDYEE